MPYDPPPDNPVPSHVVREKVKVPAIFLLVVGVLNVLAGFGLGGLSLYLFRVPPAEFAQRIEDVEKSYPFLQRILQQARAEGLTTEDMRQQGVVQYGVWAGVALFAGLLAVLGGVFMLKLRGYGLAVVGAGLTAIPCISPMGCCGIGEAIGIWALVVLFNHDVRMGFGTGRPPAEGGPLDSPPFPP
jgi:hypothetical protein